MTPLRPWPPPATDDLAHKVYLFHPLREPLLRSAIRTWSPSPGSRGLDAGCGIGLPALLLAEAVGPDGRVVGLDLSPGLLAYAETAAERSGLSDRMSWQRGDVNRLPFHDECFDWAWSVDCVGYMPRDPLPLIREMARVVRPGGVVAVMAWSSQQLLPGYPALETRLNATATGIAPFVQGMRPERHFPRGAGWFGQAGLSDASAHTFVGQVQAPLTDEQRRALTCLFEMRWEGARSEATPGDWAEYQRLCRPESSDFILNIPDYYAFFTYTLLHGRKV
ncbi:MAG: methyltransferase domain-containing protein [Proteobacteria bacterium]|nr:methyltransferase domain-containing protein [Pseudomonadota bacterium]MBU1742539.1 methyltransferase domain-containing protein [Pseudomonadota bacterium]